VKQSGVGREGGEEALRFFTEPKNVCIAKQLFDAKGAACSAVAFFFTDAKNVRIAMSER
jgi:hypothetical protein